MATLALFGGAAAVSLPEPEVVAPEDELRTVRWAADALSAADWRAALAGGGPVGALEQAVARQLEVPFVLAVASGTVALEVALRAGGVGLGDEVLLSPYDWGAATGAVLRIGAVPIFADIDPWTYTLSP